MQPLITASRGRGRWLAVGDPDGGEARQRQQLVAEGVTFTPDGSVDLGHTRMIEFKD
jgi:hypothetical protein